MGVTKLMLAGLSATVVVLSADASRAQNAYQFALIGDMPYTKVQEREYGFVLAELNRSDLAFVVHIGDFQFDARPYNQNPSAASMPCVDDNYKAVYDSFQTIRHPFILTLGDNDWTDCWPLQAQKVDPLELLGKIRGMFYPDGKSLGQRAMPVQSQSQEAQFSKFRENLRWSIQGVSYATLHIVGSNDNFGRTPEMDAEHIERKAANIAWMKAARSSDVANLPQSRHPHSTITSRRFRRNWNPMTSRWRFCTVTRIYFVSTNHFTARRPIACLKTSRVSKPSAGPTPTGYLFW